MNEPIKAPHKPVSLLNTHGLAINSGAINSIGGRVFSSGSLRRKVFSYAVNQTPFNPALR